MSLLVEKGKRDNTKMFTLTKEFSFEAAHLLPNHEGKCRRLHGHSFKMRVEVRRSNLVTGGPKDGMVIDYGDISQVVKPLLEEFLDHRYLNEFIPNPTSENLAQWIFEILKPSLPDLFAVEIDETCTSACRYQP